MQTGRQDLSHLRQRLLEAFQFTSNDLAPFLSDHPLIKGTVYTLRRKCSKPACRCARGEKHESVVLTASIGGKTRLWMIPKDRLEEVQEQTERYRQFRQARSRLLKESAKRQAEMLRVLDAIERARIRTP